MKGQAQIIQFIMFFMIGLAIFLAIGGVFKGRIDTSSTDLAEQSRKVVNSYFSALALTSTTSCKQCDWMNTTTRLVNVTAGAFSEVRLSAGKVETYSPPTPGNYTTSGHNILAGIKTVVGSGASHRPITLSYSKTQSILEVR